MMTEDSKTCLRHEAEGRYCWPSDVEVCANCQQILKNRAKELGDLIDQKILQRVKAAIAEYVEQRNLEEASRPPVKGIPKG